jgi:hypothetical protein
MIKPAWRGLRVTAITGWIFCFFDRPSAMRTLPAVMIAARLAMGGAGVMGKGTSDTSAVN